MAKQGLSVPVVILNNEALAIVPNSLVYDGGEVEVEVSAMSVGGGKTESVHYENAEGAVSMVKFELAMTSLVDQIIAECKSQTAGNVIQFVHRVGKKNLKRTFTGMSLVNRPERNVGSDGTVELEFKGDQMR